MQPPSFGTIYLAYLADKDSKYLRLGQWFFNRYLGGVEGKDIDILYNTLDTAVALSIIKKYYEAYKWEV